MWRWIVKIFGASKDAEAKKKKAMDLHDTLSGEQTQSIVLSEKAKALIERETEKSGRGK